MKSLLVDALRQANGEGTDKALSDSGSFDTSSQDFGETANDGELELMSTHSALIVREPEAEPQEAEAETELEVAVEPEVVGVTEHDEGTIDDEHAMTIVGMQALPLRDGAMPRLARFSPLLCLVAAALVAASWLLAHATGLTRAGLGAVVDEPAMNEGAQAVVFGETTRFPFLRPGEPLDAEDEVQ